MSDLVRTEYGFHIIKIERSRPGERAGRHILIRPDMTADDLEAIKDTAAVVVQRAQAGESMRELWEAYSDPEAPDSVTVTQEQIQGLPPGYEGVGIAIEGDVLGPIEYLNPRGETRVSVLQIVEVREAGQYTFADVRPQISDMLQQQKLQEAILERLREKTHIEIRR